MPLPDYGETLRPDFAVRELEPKEGAPAWQLLVRVLEPGEDFDHVVRGGGQLEASPHGRMERLLRQTGVPAGLLFNGRALRLLSAPRGESSGWLDFRVADMVQTAGRPISTALRLLLGQPRLLSLPRAQRLAALLEDSRKFQNEVSERLAEQVLHALYELLRGFQAAHDASKGELLRQPLAEHPDEVYRALLTVILRLVFLLYAEERDMLPEDETFLRYYSLAGLYERLREDAALFPDTMDQRYGAWAQLLVLFRMIHDGAELGRHAAAPAPRRPLRPRPLPVPRGPPERRRAPDARADRAAARARRHHLPRAREAARPRRRAHLLPRARRGADRLGLRDDDGLPARDRDRPLGGDQGPEEAGRTDDGGPRGAARASPRPSARSGSRTAPTASSPTRSRRPWPGPRRSRTCTRRCCR